MGPGSPRAQAPPENEGPQERGPVDRSCVRPIFFIVVDGGLTIQVQ